jgi:hypothetical protein
MQLADSMRLKASNKISAGVMGNARENSGSFSAGIRFKSNQYLLQSRRANIQNSLSYLDVQRDAIMEARDIMERIALTKIKFDAPTLNASDRKNLNTEFSELTDELISLREKKFNGVSLFTPTLTSSSELFGGSRTSLETGSEANNGVGISQHVIDYQDVRNIFDAGDGVKRGKAGLAVINFEKDPVQEQIEKITIGGIIADGDKFQLQLNELSSIREVEYTSPVIEYIAGQGTDDIGNALGSDESLALTSDIDGIPDTGDEVFNQQLVRTRVRDQLIKKINEAANSPSAENPPFVKAYADPSDDNSLLIRSEGAGDPFELFNVSSSNNAVDFTSSVFTANGINDAEERTLQLDFKDNARNTGVVVQANDQITVTMDDANGNAQVFTYTVDTNHLTNPPTWWTDPSGNNGSPFSSDTGTDPQEEWLEASKFMLAGLANEITNDPKGVNVDASILPSSWSGTAGEQGHQLRLRSTERGVPLNVRDFNVSLAQSAVPEVSSTIAVTLTRDMIAGDSITLTGRSDNADSAHRVDGANATGEVFTQDFTFNGTVNGVTITSNETLKDAILAHSNVTSATYVANAVPGTGGTLTINVLNTEDDQPILTIDELATWGKVITDPRNQTQNGTVVSSFSNVATTTTKGTGTGVVLDVNNINSNGSHNTSVLHIDTSTTPNTTQRGSGYEVGDTFKVLGSLMNGDDGGVGVGNDFNYTVNTLVATTAEVKELTYSMPNTTKLVDGTYLNVTDTSGHLTLDLTVDTTETAIIDKVKIDNYDDRGTGDGFAVGDTITISALKIGGGEVIDDAGLSKSSTGGTNASLIDGTYAGITDSGGVTVDVAIAGGVVTISNLTAGGAGYTAGQDITFNGSQVGGVDGVNDLTITVGAAALNAEDITLTISKIQGAVDTFSFSSGTAKTSWSYTDEATNATNPNNPGGVSTGSGLKLDYTIDRNGVLSDVGINGSNNGTSYEPGDVITVGKLGVFTGAQITLQNANVKHNLTDNKYEAPTRIEGNLQSVFKQYVPDKDIHMSTNIELNESNIVGTKKVIHANISSDSASDGVIAPGDILRVQVQEQLHTDESNVDWPETTPRSALSTPGLTDPNVIEVTAMPGESTDDVANRLTGRINTWITDTNNVPANQLDNLPVATYNNGDNYIKFEARKAGEDFAINIQVISTEDDIPVKTGLSTWTVNPGGSGDPSGSSSFQKNISPFSVTKSISYFEEMLAQNEAETSRLMKAMEHLENSMIHNEDALSKVQDTDYSQASVEQMRNAVKVQMANNVMGKSMRMNDLLIDLTTKHYRGSMLNAKA